MITIGQERIESVEMQGGSKTLCGKVIYIHPDGNYYMVEFPVRGGKIRQCYHFTNPADKPAPRKKTPGETFSFPEIDIKAIGR